MSLAVSLMGLSLAACKSTKKSGYSDVVDYTTPDTNLSQSEYPFDEKGNYLADVVSGKKKGSKNKAIEPPKSYVDTYEKPQETTVAAAPASTGHANYETPPAASSDPYAPVYSSGSSGSGSTATGPKYTSNTSSSNSKPRASSSSSSSKSKPKSKPVAKAKPKPKSSSMSYTVKRGDTLYSLASRYGTSVSAIKKASGLSGDMLRDGRTIKIPRK